MEENWGGERVKILKKIPKNRLFGILKNFAIKKIHGNFFDPAVAENDPFPPPPSKGEGGDLGLKEHPVPSLQVGRQEQTMRH